MGNIINEKTVSNKTDSNKTVSGVFAGFDAASVKDAAILWLKNYFLTAPAHTKAVVGISGGKDSSVVAALLAAALGKDRVLGVLMPQNIQSDINYSKQLCEFLGIKSVVINIGGAAQEIFEGLKGAGLTPNDVVTINTPARVRMSVLYAVAACVGGRVANTSNLSEDFVGYATKFGDTAGDFSPLSLLTVTEVLAVGHSLGLPKELVDKPPSDGLSGQDDEQRLGFSYQALDKFIRQNQCEDKAVKEKIENLHKQSRHKLEKLPSFNPFEKN